MLDFIQDIGELIKIITLVKDRTQEEIATSMGYTRPHFNRLLNSEPDGELLIKAKNIFKDDILLFVRKYGSLGLTNDNKAAEPTLEQVAISMEVLAQSVRQIANSAPSGLTSLPVQNLDKGKKKDLGVPFSGNRKPHSAAERKGRQKDIAGNSDKENN